MLFVTLLFSGRSAGIRTLGPLIKSQLLYQLSYRPLFSGDKSSRLLLTGQVKQDEFC